MAKHYEGTFQELLVELKATERDTSGLEVQVANKIRRDDFLQQMTGAEFDKELNEMQVMWATHFIETKEAEGNASITDETTHAAQSCLQNAWDTVGDYGVDYDSIVALFIVSAMYSNEAIQDCEV